MLIGFDYNQQYFLDMQMDPCKLMEHEIFEDPKKYTGQQIHDIYQLMVSEMPLDTIVVLYEEHQQLKSM